VVPPQESDVLLQQRAFSWMASRGAHRNALHESTPLLISADAKQLMDLCQQGKLYEIEEWITAGKSLQVPLECRTSPLRIAMERGFHSLVVLLARSDVGQQAKNDALLRAVSGRNLEIVELLLKHEADFHKSEPGAPRYSAPCRFRARPDPGRII
jgi:hypothetical protein